MIQGLDKIQINPILFQACALACMVWSALAFVVNGPIDVVLESMFFFKVPQYMAGIFVNIRCPNKQQSIHDYKNNRAIDSHLFSPAYMYGNVAILFFIDYDYW